MINWSLHMLGSSVTMLGRLSESHAYLTEGTEAMVRAGETTGLVLVLDDWVDYASSRRLRARIAPARRRQTSPGTDVDRPGGMVQPRPACSGRAFPGIDDQARARLEAEGAALTLDQAVALAL